MSKTVIILAGLAMGAALPTSAIAHGTMELPVSRVLNCYNEGAESPKSGGCKAARAVGGAQQFYDWNGVRQGGANGDHKAVVADGMLCSGGSSLFRGLDLPRGDWQQTSIVPTPAGDYTFVWRATARHATQYFKYYITRDGWDPSKALAWSDLEEFASVPGSSATNEGGRYRMNVRLPAGKKGSHIIYSVWQRNDSPEAFYACADVKFPGDGVAAPSAGWEDQGPLVAAGDLAAGTRLTFRVMDASGRDIAKHTVDVVAGRTGADAWAFQLAQKVNAESHVFRIGELQSRNGVANVVPQTSATQNRVYLGKGYEGYKFEVDKEAPSSGNGATGNSGNAGAKGGTPWAENVSYEIGQVVTYNGRRYACRQRHTAWAGAGWTPAATPALWRIVR
ncbi:lytic polysaccharide monooxygenase [Cupriavidus sp. 2SB]|uniref:lytic polysaccharide monooxygenase n=1 Tax=Cupriavidus sp. 2SB TaxID=2502199 RepID=UPI0010F5AC9F|nr:lytic polysaccharide monooxygenase [Cupriavidus sp. 2SB]